MAEDAERTVSGRGGEKVSLSQNEVAAVKCCAEACLRGEVTYVNCHRDPVDGEVREVLTFLFAGSGTPRQRFERLRSDGWDGPRIVIGERVADLVMLEIEKRELSSRF